MSAIFLWSPIVTLTSVLLTLKSIGFFRFDCKALNHLSKNVICRVSTSWVSRVLHTHTGTRARTAMLLHVYPLLQWIARRKYGNVNFPSFSYHFDCVDDSVNDCVCTICVYKKFVYLRFVFKTQGNLRDLLNSFIKRGYRIPLCIFFVICFISRASGISLKRTKDILIIL